MDASGDVTSGGVMLPESAKEKPLSGSVLATGPGKKGEDGSVTEPKA